MIEISLDEFKPIVSSLVSYHGNWLHDIIKSNILLSFIKLNKFISATFCLKANLVVIVKVRIFKLRIKMLYYR